MAVTYATQGDYLRAHLKGGPESDWLLFTSAYYQQEIDRPESRLIEALRSQPDAPGLLAPGHAASDAIEIFHPEYANKASSGIYKGVMQRYTSAAWQAIFSYQLSPDIEVDDLTFEGSMLTPATELREVGRLAVQQYKVMLSLAEKGVVPVL